MKQVMRAASGTFLGMFNMFSGGALEQLSIFALGIMPYVSASIILQLLTVVVPHARASSAKKGEQGQQQDQPVHPLRHDRAVAGAGVLHRDASFEGLNRTYAQCGDVVANPGLGFQLLTMLTLTTGTAFIMWLGEQITERGIGNGISLIIFAGIVAAMPDALVAPRRRSVERGRRRRPHDPVHARASSSASIAAIIFFERGQRRIPVQYAKRVGRPEDVRRRSRRTCRSRSTSPASSRRSSRRRS